MSKKKNELVLSNDVIEFQPDAIELANRKLPWWASAGVLWLFGFLLIAIIWASVCKVDVLVQCNGKVVSLTPGITMSPLDRMIISEILVSEGDEVKAGDVLLRFDPTLNEADYRNISEQIAKLQPEYDRLLAEFEGREYVPTNPKDHNQQIQLALFNQRKRSYESQDNYYKALIATTESQIKATNDSIKKLEALLEEFTKMVVAYRELVAKQATAALDLVNIEMNRINYEGQLTNYRNALPSYESQLASNHAQRQAFIDQWHQQISEEYNTSEQNLTTAKEQFEKVKRMQDYYELVAPCDAVVHEVAKYAIGSAVREAEPVIMLIPKEEDFIMEIEIPAKDVGKVKVGDRVTVKLNPYPFQTWGKMIGELYMISEDTFTRNQPTDMATALTGNTYYRGKVRITQKFTKEPENFIMKAGMEGQAEIITGDRRIISYIFHPLIKMLDESVREP